MSIRRYFWLNVMTPTIAPGAVPDAVDDLAATAGNGQMALTWTAPAAGGSPITGYQIYRSIAAGAYALLTTVTGTSYTDAGLVNGQAHAYKLKTLSALGASADSNIVSGTPAAPSGYVTPGPRAFSYPSQPAPTGGGTTTTVAPSGLQAAITAASAGSVIVVTNGTLTGGINITNKSGSSGNPITVYSQNHLGAKLNMTGTGTTDGFWMDGTSSHFRFIGLEIYGNQHAQAPIRLRGSTNNVSFENCFLHTNYSATPQSTMFVIDNGVNNISVKKSTVKGSAHPTEGHGLRFWRCQQILVEDCTLLETRKFLIQGQNLRDVDLRYNHFSHGYQGYHHFAIDPGSGLGFDKGLQREQHIDYNVFDFDGTWVTNQGDGHVSVQFQNSAGAGWRIRGNISKRPLPNASPSSLSEDHFNMGRSGGTSGSPMLIEHNRVRGGGPSGSGTGTILDGGDDYVHIQDNCYDRTGQVGIGVAGGNFNIVRRNKVYSPAITFTATNQGTNVGIYAWVNSLGATNGCSNITVQGNRVFWAYGNAAVNSKPFGSPNPYWDGGNCGSINWANGNTWQDTSLGPSIFDEPIPLV